MTSAEAKLLLSYHSGRNDDTSHEKWKSGFLGSLRPYRGALIEANFHEVIACLRKLAPELRSGESIDRQVTSDVVGIVHLGRLWGVSQGGMLRRNGLIAEADWKRLEQWIETIMYSFMMILDGCDDQEAFAEYYHYQSGRGEPP